MDDLGLKAMIERIFSRQIDNMKLVFISTILLLVFSALLSCTDGDSEICTAMDDQISPFEESELGILFTPWKGRFFTEENGSLFLHERKISFSIGSYDPWVVPLNPDWKENPYNDVSWQMHYQSLVWLYSPAYEWFEKKNSEAEETVRNYIQDWIDKNPISSPASKMSWYDHAVANRVSMFSYFYFRFFRERSEDPLTKVLEGSVRIHADQLISFLSDSKFRGNNHNFIHALALYNLSRIFHLWPEALSWKKAALNRLHRMKDELVDMDGVSVEQSTGYHFSAIRLFLSANRLLTENDKASCFDSLSSLRKMTDFAALITWPDGTLPAIGNTPFGTNAFEELRSFWELGIGGPYLRGLFEESEDTGLMQLFEFPLSGYALIRPWPIASDIKNVSAVLFKAGPSRHSHGHNDALNVLFYTPGGALLVDSGGPYKFDSQIYTNYFRHPKSHNTVVVDSMDMHGGDAKLFDNYATDDWAFIRGTHAKFSGIQHLRSLLLLYPGTFLIIDHLNQNHPSATAKEFNLLFHISPNAKVKELERAFEIELAEGLKTCTTTWASNPLQRLVTLGDEDENFPSWVTTTKNAKKPKTLLRYSSRNLSTSFVTIFAPSSEIGCEYFSLEVTELLGKHSVTFRNGGKNRTVEVPFMGKPTIY